MMCTVVQYTDEDEDIVLYGDQEFSTEEYEKATNGELAKTMSEEEEEVKCNVAQCTNSSVIHWKGKGGDLTKQHPMNTYMTLVRVTFH